MLKLARYRLLFFFAIVTFVFSATFLAIKLAQGYKIDFSAKTLRPSGLLVVSSTPTGAEVFINGELKTATNNTLSLPPGKYWVEIKKNGFSSWKKELVVEKELVTQAEVVLFPQVPDLRPLTFQEVQNPQLSPDGSKIVYTVPLPHQQAGLWVMELTDFFLNLGREPRQILAADQIPLKNLSLAQYYWSPDSKQILLTFPPGEEKFLLDAGQLNSAFNLTNIAPNWSKTAETWQKENQVRLEAKLKKLPQEMQKILSEKATQINFSPDGTKVLYVATDSAEIPERLIPPVLAASTQLESRKLEKGKTYVYDLKEDKNFLIPFEGKLPAPSATPLPKKTKITPTPSLSFVSEEQPSPQWFPTSRHLFWIENDKVVTCEYDGTNLTTLYSGVFIKPYVFVSPSANRLIILTQLGSETKPNLYAISLK